MQTPVNLSIKNIYGHRAIDAAGIPMFSLMVRAGMPTSGDDIFEGRIDLNGLLIDNPESTFFIRVEGRPMKDAGIHPGDMLIVDRSVDAEDNSVVIADVGGELAVLPKAGGTDRDKIWGVVMFVIHAV